MKCDMTKLMYRTLCLAVALLLAACSGSVGSSGAKSSGTTVSVTISPTVASVAPGGTQAFAASVSGTTNTAVTWSVTEGGGGTIDSSGQYAAPGSNGTFHVVARSVADATAFGSAIVTVAANGYVLPSDRSTTWSPGLSYSSNHVSSTTPAMVTGAGIPHYTTIFATLSPITGNNAAAINAALAGAAAAASRTNPLVVKLNEGTFNISGNNESVLLVGSYTVLRGTTDAQGNLLTKIIRTDTDTNNNPGFGNVVIGPLWGDTKWDTFVDLTADAVKGANSVTVSSVSGFVVGDLIHLDESDDLVNRVWLQQDVPAWSRAGRHIAQNMEIASIDTVNNRLTFTTPFHLTFRVSQAAQLARMDSTHQPVRWAGVEDLYVYGGQGGDGSGGNFDIENGMYSWIKHVEGELSHGPGIGLEGCFRCEVRDSYIHHAYNNHPGGSEYGFTLDSGTADSLVENSIALSFGKGFTVRSAGLGCVAGYNYVDDLFDGANSDYQEGALQAAHEGTPAMMLFEGNEAPNAQSDNTHGNSINIVWFRNHLTGMRRTPYSAWRVSQGQSALPTVVTQYHDNSSALSPLMHWNCSTNPCSQVTGPMVDAGLRSMVNITAHARNFSFVGNVLGFSGQPMNVSQAPQTTASYDFTAGQDAWSSSIAWIWSLGNGAGESGHSADAPDVTTVSSTLRHGNFNFALGTVAAGTVWNGTDSHALPSSLYITSKPAFMGVNAWPWVIPEDTLSPLAGTLPARARIDAGTPNVVP
jgi:hypothetical protein